jgi:uncharacterized protein involved in response to NO
MTLAHNYPRSRATPGLARIPLLSYGFRPFFLGGALWAAIAMPLWLGLITGQLDFAGEYGPIAWHAHEFLFGYVSAIVAGFLLTAIPNWTGRLPVRGGALLALFAVWFAGRAALLFSDQIGLAAATTVDGLFLPVLALVVLREIVAGNNWRNAKVAVLIALLAAANIGFHIEVILSGMADYALRAGIAVIVGLVMLIGGRITSSFTRNWLAARGSKKLPAPFGRFDMAAIAASALALLSWIALPDARLVGAALIAAGLVQFVRLSRWTGLSTLRELLVLVLHAGYAFVPLGFLLVGAGILWPMSVPASALLHAWTAGMVGLMTLAVMTRASLGHSGQALSASAGTRAIYGAVAFAALTRILAGFPSDWTNDLLTVSAIAWTMAFAGFVALYGPLLLRRRPTTRDSGD